MEVLSVREWYLWTYIGEKNNLTIYKLALYYIFLPYIVKLPKLVHLEHSQVICDQTKHHTYFLNISP